MPELPEVETTRRGLAPHLENRCLQAVLARRRDLRWPIPTPVTRIADQPIRALDRRAKYLLLQLPHGCVLLHLGMSGALRLVDADSEPGPHDHVDLVLDNGRCVRFSDPRRFGSVLWQRGREPERHPRLRGLGPEPLADEFTGAWLRQRSRGRRAAVKTFIMDPANVVGVGNIYASEALFRAGIHPARAAGRISLGRYRRLAAAIKATLDSAIEAGGTTLRDFLHSDGRPGYFRQQINVYDRAGEPCRACGAPVAARMIGQRSSYYCPRCQR